MSISRKKRLTMAYRFGNGLMGFSLMSASLVGCQSFEKFPSLEGFPSTVILKRPPTSTVTDPNFLQAIEQAIYDEINQHRVSQNLPPLQLNPQITQQARIHSQRMASGLMEVDQDNLQEKLTMIGRQIPYHNGVENLGVHHNRNEPIQAILKIWLNNSQNRQNIQGDFDLTGVGVAQNQLGHYYFTQIFIKEKPPLISQKPDLGLDNLPFNPKIPNLFPEKPLNPSELSENNLISLEQKIHQRVNEYRQSQGLPPLTLNAHISQVARLHSQKMAGKIATFSHDGFDERAKAIGVRIPYQSVSENLAYLKGYPDLVATAVQGWINSPGHRQAMEGDFNFTGVGIAKNASGEYYFTQLFVLKR